MLYEQINRRYKSIRKVSLVNYITSKVLDKWQVLNNVWMTPGMLVFSEKWNQTIPIYTSTRMYTAMQDTCLYQYYDGPPIRLLHLVMSSHSYSVKVYSFMYSHKNLLAQFSGCILSLSRTSSCAGVSVYIHNKIGLVVCPIMGT